MNNKALVNKWCDKGLSLYTELDKESLISFYYHFNFYKSLHNDQDDIKRYSY